MFLRVSEYIFNALETNADQNIVEFPVSAANSALCEITTHPPTDQITFCLRQSYRDGIGCLLGESSKDLPPGDRKAIAPSMVSADVHKSDKPTRPAVLDHECFCEV
jgi:hypothetical protein